VDAVLHIEQFRQAIGMTTPLPEEGTGRFTTLSGFLQRALGRLPQEGDVVNVAGLSFEVVDMDGHRVDKLIVTKKV
jgi:putative hemolysin